jgi:GT2 family glycosyltransferase
MPKVTIVQVIYNNKKFIEPVFNAIFNQTFKDFNVVAVISGNDDGGKELLMQKFPQVEIIDPGYNIGFAAGHNLVFEKYGNLSGNVKGDPLHSLHLADFFQLVNPDMIMQPNYIEEMLKVFADPKVGAATGKLYQVSGDKLQVTGDRFNELKPTFKTLDTTGVTIAKSGRAKDRGQHEVDEGQYDVLTEVDAVSGAGCMYRRSALEAVKIQRISDKLQVTSHGNGAVPVTSNLLPVTNFEYFDESFHSYWEDVDLSWRMKNKGWKNVFAPKAIGYHGRAAGSSRGGYLHIVDFIKHHRQLSPFVRQLNYKNHILMYLKNSKHIYPQFLIREFFMFWYILIFEPSTLKVVPKMLKLLPKIWVREK